MLAEKYWFPCQLPGAVLAFIINQYAGVSSYEDGEVDKNKQNLFCVL
jgi:hypothetical protein